MTLLVVFAVLLVAAVLISGLAERSILSTAVLFLAAGIVLSSVDLVGVAPSDPATERIAELALFAVLFTDGMRVGVRDLAGAWRLPGRALLFGLPLTLLGTALLAHYVARLPWPHALLLGAVLSPTDPVFASAIVGREDVPGRLRRLLNIESGLNDGLALPVVIILLQVVGAPEDISAAFLEVGEGLLLGVAVPWAALRLERSRFFSAHGVYEPLNGFAVGLLVYALGSVLHANLFVAAFAAGMTVASVAPRTRSAFHQFGELVTELFKLAALLAFGLLVSLAFLAEIPWQGYLFALLALLLVRPVALGLALLGSGLRGREFVAAAWFGPKGFASVVYGLLILHEGIPLADEVFHLVALVIVASIIAHSSTDVVVARWFHQHEKPDEAGRGRSDGEAAAVADDR